jgi:hypothetical protein
MPTESTRKNESRSGSRPVSTQAIQASELVCSKSSPNLNSATTMPGIKVAKTKVSVKPSATSLDVTETPKFLRFVAKQKPPTPYAESQHIDSKAVVAAALGDSFIFNVSSISRRRPHTTSTLSHVVSLSTPTPYHPQQSASYTSQSTKSSSHTTLFPSTTPEMETLPEQKTSSSVSKSNLRFIHTPPADWGFASGGSMLSEGMLPLPLRSRGGVRGISSREAISSRSAMSSRGATSSRRSTDTSTSTSDIHPPLSSPLSRMESGEMDIIDIPRSTSAGNVIISARLQMALLQAKQRPTSCPGDPAGRVSASYFRPSTANASINSLSSLYGNEARPSTGSRPPSSIGSVEESHASTKIQSIMRMKKANIYTWNPNGGLAAETKAIIIQRISRGFIVRNREKIKQRELENIAATLIQSIFRGQLGRFHAMDLRIERRHNALILLQCAWRVSIANGRVRLLRLHKRKIHSTKIQAWWRGTFVQSVLTPNPIQERKKRIVMQRAMIRKHIVQLEANKLAEKKKKMLKDRMKEASKHNLVVSSRRRRRRSGNRGTGAGKVRGGGRNVKRPVFKPVNSTPVDPVALLREVLLYHSIDNFRNSKIVDKIFKPNVPFLRRTLCADDKNIENKNATRNQLLPVNQEVASFVRISIVHALSSQGTIDIVGSALATLQDISFDLSRKQKLDQQKQDQRNGAVISKMKKKRGKRSPEKQKINLPRMAYSNIIRDYYHANIIQNPDDLEGLRHLITALLVGAETDWRDDFEFGKIEKKKDDKIGLVQTVGVNFYERLRRMTNRLLAGAKQAVEFRRQSWINARNANNEDNVLKFPQTLSKAETPRGSENSSEEKQLRMSELIVNLSNNWFFAPLKMMNGGASFMTDRDTGAILNIRRRGTWFVVDGCVPTNSSENETIPVESFVMSTKELEAITGEKTKNDRGIIKQLMRHVKIVRIGGDSVGCNINDVASSGALRVVVVPVERRRLFIRYTRKRKAAAIVIQRCYKGRRLLNAMQRRVALHRRSRVEHVRLLNSIIEKHKKAHAHHVHLVDKVKAAFIARRQRKQLRNLHKNASTIQRAMRAYLAWLRDEEKKNWEKYGAQVRTMYERPKIVSGKALVVRIQRAGKNWMLRGIDHSLGEVYQGLVKEQQILQLIKKYPYGRDQGYSTKRRARLYIKEHSRVLLLILDCLAVTDAIDGLGELNGYDGNRIMICDPEFGSKADGPSILSMAGQGRVLNDCKDVVPKDPKGVPEEL